MDDLGTRLKAARKSAGLTQGDVSSRLGLGAGVITAYETGKSGVSDARLRQLAALYGVEVRELAGRVVEDDRPDAFYDGILHALATFNKASGELIAEVQEWRARQTEARDVRSIAYQTPVSFGSMVSEPAPTAATPPVSRAKLDETGRRQLAKDAADARKRRGTG